MTIPIWMAAPPEVHATLLSSGPGPGPLLASAAAWTALSTEYTEAAADLTALLGGVQAGAWAGPTAEAYAAAHAPYLSWLLQASADSAAAAAQQETAAAGYTAALAAMPTLAELAANHATHAVLLGTNFFGINAIPIALNEADYVRMWIQAAATMNAYQGVAAAAVTGSPHTVAAPPIVQANAAAGDPFSWLTDFLAQVESVFNNVGGGQNTDLLSYIFSVPPGTDPLTWFVNKFGVLSSNVTGYPALLQGLLNAAGNNPVLIVAAYMFGFAAIGYDLAIQAVQFFVTFPLLSVALAPLAALPVLAGLAGGTVGVAEIAAHVHEAMEPVADAPLAPIMSSAPAPASAAPTSPSAPAPASATGVSAPAPAGAAVGAPGAPAPPGGAGPGPFPYIVGGVGRMSAQAGAKVGAKRKTPASDSASEAAGAAAAAQDKRRRRRRRQAEVEERGRGFVYADLDDYPADDSADDDPGANLASTGTSDRGAGTLGFAGTGSRESVVAAAGLTTLAGDPFGDGPTEPMVPGSWTPEGR